MAERTACAYVDHNRELFHVPAVKVTEQFSSLYFMRLCELRGKVEAAASQRWGSDILNRKVKTLDAEPGAPVLVVGTLYREMKGKPNIMEELNRDPLLEVFASDERKAAEKYVGEGDVVFLEDDSGRLALQLTSELADDVLVTGAVVAVKGTLSETGELDVEGICLPGMPPQAPRAALAGPPAGRYVAVVSGLRVGHDAHDMLPLQLLAEHLTGQLGCDEDHRMQANIVRLIVAGNATGCAAAGEGEPANAAGGDVLKKMAPNAQKSLAEHARYLDLFLTTVGAAMPVDLMPGAGDPCNYLLPQQPFHPCMLPQAAKLSSLNLCTNPYCADVDGMRVLGTSGQPLDDMQRYLPGDDRLATLTRTLEFQHLAPTAPDTLGCYPYAGDSADPFVVRECPHVFFAGNQPRYESKLVEGPAGQRVCAIMVPDFCRDHTCVLVNLDTLESQPIVFAGL